MAVFVGVNFLSISFFCLGSYAMMQMSEVTYG
jgi:hypothetical protein